MKTKIGIVFLTFALSSGVALAETKEELAEELLVRMGVPKQGEVAREMTDRVIENQLQRVPEHLRESARKVYSQVTGAALDEVSWDRMKDDFIRIYAEVFTEQELRDVLAFYRTPAGEKFVEKQPQLARAAVGLMQEKMEALQSLMRDAHKQVMEEMKKESERPSEPQALQGLFEKPAMEVRQVLSGREADVPGATLGPRSPAVTAKYGRQDAPLAR